MPGGKRTRSLAWENKNHTSVVAAGTRRDHPAFPHANGFNGFLRALPGDRACLSPSPAQRVSVVAVLTPASGRQDHTSIFWHPVKHAETNKTL
jgi:hypothetical protein